MKKSCRHDSIFSRFWFFSRSAAWIQGFIVSSALIGGALGSIGGGIMADVSGERENLVVGRRRTILVADLLFCIAALLMALAPNIFTLILGRFIVGIAIGAAAVVVPVYIAEHADVHNRAKSVSLNILGVTFGQLAAYFSNYIFSVVPGNWRWMLGISLVPSLLQMIGLWILSPQKLSNDSLNSHHSKGPGSTAPKRIRSLKEKLISIRSIPVPAELHVGIGLQILQQACGINTIMYFLPVMLKLTGIHSNRTALLVSMIPASCNAFGTLLGMRLVDRIGRRRLLHSSLLGVISALLVMGLSFEIARRQSPKVDPVTFSYDQTCPFQATSCPSCLHHNCIYCGSALPSESVHLAGACIQSVTFEEEHDLLQRCQQALQGTVELPHIGSYDIGCPAPEGTIRIIFVCICLYLLAFSPGLGPIPWAIGAEIYPEEDRGICGGLAATCNWISNAVMSQCFLGFMTFFGGGITFGIIASFAIIGTFWSWKFVPETKGLTFSEIQSLFWRRMQ